MDFIGLKVLVLDGYGRQILTILQELHDEGCVITTLNYSKFDCGYASRYPHRKLLEPRAQTDTEYLQAVIDREIMSGTYDFVLSMLERSTKILAANYDRYSQHTSLCCPRLVQFMRACDKQETMEICMNNDIPCPVTRRQTEDLQAFIDRVGFPVVVKPREGSGSIGFRIVRSQDNLDALLASGKLVPSEFVIQEYIPQDDTQYGVHMLLDDTMSVKLSVCAEKARWYPLDGGASCCSRTVHDPVQISDCMRLLKAMQWRGYCQVDLIADPRDGVSKVMEINGRISASVKMCHIAGQRVVPQLLELALGRPVRTYSEYEENLCLRYMQTDILWFLKSPKRFHVNPSWFRLRKTGDQIISWRDPWPFFVYSLHAVTRYRTDIKKRART